ncbi:MAG: Sau3AI family type II restriction endonuclease [Sphaerochaetaceae bacterium]|nr:Sau3AI family type II restriction endonuclease [Sphaerochaetaceae bacterium]
MEFKDKKDLLDYARKLEGLSISEANINNSVSEQDIKYGKNYSGKGKFGQFIEENYFDKKNDSLSAPDFSEVGVELKVSPLKYLKNGEIRVKERLVLNIISYDKLLNDKNFLDSHFIYKNKSILLIFYFYDNKVPLYKLKVNLVDIWELLDRDFNQIKRDYEYIVEKVENGLAHEISEGDTMYLGACTKGSTQKKSMIKQPNSKQLARRRAFCFKTSYINTIYKTLVLEKRNRISLENRLIKDSSTNFENYINNLFKPYLGKTVHELCLLFDCNIKSKSVNANIARKIIGFNKKNKTFYEFEAAGIQIKTIRVELNGKIKEHMSFKNIYYTEIINEIWEDSAFYEELVSKFIFVIFKKNLNNQGYHLDHINIWNMPQNDIDEAKKVWKITKENIRKGIFDKFPRASENIVSHVRPKGQSSSDLMETEGFGLQKKYCFWLNKDYIKSQI